MASTKTKKSTPKRKKKDFKITPLKGEQSSLEVLSKDEDLNLKKLERIIKGGWDTFVEVGIALSAIRDGRLYRAKHRTFEAYCRARWHYGKAHAYRLIGAAEVVSDLSPLGDIQPMSESQVRPLLALQRDERVKAWKAAVEAAGEKPLTARVVKEAASSYFPEKRRKRKREQAGSDEAIWRQAFEALEKAVESVKGNEGAISSLEELRECLKGLSDRQSLELRSRARAGVSLQA